MGMFETYMKSKDEKGCLEPAEQKNVIVLGKWFNIVSKTCEISKEEKEKKRKEIAEYIEKEKNEIRKKIIGVENNLKKLEEKLNESMFCVDWDNVEEYYEKIKQVVKEIKAYESLVKFYKFELKVVDEIDNRLTFWF